MESGQFYNTRIIGKNAHVGAIYLLHSGLYNSLAWAIVYYMDRAVQSLNTVISIVSTLLYF